MAFFVPLFRKAVAFSFYLSHRLFFRLEVKGLEKLSSLASTLVVVNHQRDMDMPLLGSTLYYAFPHQRTNLWFMAEEDLFYTGYFPYHFDLPSWLAFLTFDFSLEKPIKALGLQPISKMDDMHLGRLLFLVRRVKGKKVKMGDILSPQGLKEVAEKLDVEIPSLSSRPLQDFFNWRYHRLLRVPMAVSLLEESLARQIRSQRVEEAEKQIEFFASRLDEEGTVVLAPEGIRSLDGTFLPFRGALHRLVEESKEISVLPVTISYDFFKEGKKGAFMVFSPPLECLKGLSRQELNLVVKKGILSQFVTTLSHLGSLLFLSLKKKGEVIFPKELLLKKTREMVDLISSLGGKIDQTLRKENLKERLDLFLLFFQKKELLKEKGHCLLLDGEKLEEEPGWISNPVSYYFNEMKEMAWYPSLADYLSLEPSPISPQENF